MTYTHSGVAAVLFKNEADEVLLFKRTNTKRYPGVFCAPCGRVDPGDSFRQAAAREVREEVGIEVDEQDLDLVAVMDRPNWPDSEAKRVLEMFFVAKKWRGQAVNCEPEKHADPQWFSLHALPEPLHPYTADALGHVVSDHSNVLYKVY